MVGYRVVSLFCGCGGLDLGFLRAGFDIVYACDNDPAAIACYARNIDERVFYRDATSDAFHDDIRKISRCDVVLGGFPCQGFSKAGPKQENDSRNTLYVEMRHVVAELMPSLFIAENVDGLSQNFGGAYLKRIVADFASIGYSVDHKVLDAIAYGVPQHRRRVFFVGTRSDQGVRFNWPTPTHQAPSRNGEFRIDAGPTLFEQSARRLACPRTIRQAIEDLLDSKDVPDHAYPNSWPEKYEHVFRRIGQGQKLCNVRARTHLGLHLADPRGFRRDDTPRAAGARNHLQASPAQEIRQHPQREPAADR